MYNYEVFPATYNQLGFTVIELVMVIALLGTLSATAMPKFFNKNSYSERTLLDDALNAARYAQKLAVATGCPVQLSISSNQYTLSRSTLCANSTYTLAVPHPSSGASDFTGSETSINLTASTSPIIFDALGAASADTTISVANKCFKIVADTGYIYKPDSCS